MKAGYVRVSNPKPIPRFTMNQNVTIETEKNHGNDRQANIFRGEVISITDRLIVVQKKSGIRESFLLKDFLTGHTKLIQ